MSWNETTWKNQKTGEEISGSWIYYWAGDYFVIRLDSVDPITGEGRCIDKLYGEKPEWGDWKRVIKDDLEDDLEDDVINEDEVWYYD